MARTHTSASSSKRGREPSDDSDDVEVVDERVPKGKAKAKQENKSERPEKSARKSAYKRANISEEVDLELLHASRGTHSRRGRPGTTLAIASTEDTTESFGRMRLKWEKGSSGSQGGSSRPGSQKASSRQSSSHGGSRSRRG